MLPPSNAERPSTVGALCLVVSRFRKSDGGLALLLHRLQCHRWQKQRYLHIQIYHKDRPHSKYCLACHLFQYFLDFKSEYKCVPPQGF